VEIESQDAFFTDEISVPDVNIGLALFVRDILRRADGDLADRKCRQ
jgi:hypothetical protein